MVGCRCHCVLFTIGRLFFFFFRERAAGKLESEGDVELFPLGLMDVEPANDLRPCDLPPKKTREGKRKKKTSREGRCRSIGTSNKHKQAVATSSAVCVCLSPPVAFANQTSTVSTPTSQSGWTLNYSPAALGLLLPLLRWWARWRERSVQHSYSTGGFRYLMPFHNGKRKEKKIRRSVN